MFNTNTLCLIVCLIHEWRLGMILLLNVWDKVLSLNRAMQLDLLLVICMRVVLSLASIRPLCDFGLAANGETRVMRTTLFWVVTQRVVVISYRRFGTTYRSHLQRSRILGYYKASSGNFLPAFRDNLSIPSSGVKNLGLLRSE